MPEAKIPFDEFSKEAQQILHDLNKKYPEESTLVHSIIKEAERLWWHQASFEFNF